MTSADLRAALCRDVREGLGTRPRSMPPVWFYDDRGCALYEEITRLPEYYPFRTEQVLLRQVSGEIARAACASVLVELGSGNSEKTHELLTAMAGGPAGLAGYIGFDVADLTLRSAAQAIAEEMGIGVHAVVGDFHHHLAAIPAGGPPRLVGFLGSTIGNLVPAERRRFLGDVRGILRPSDSFLLATDLVKSVDRLVAAYDDAAGVTAAFNRNLLDVLNRELGADFAPERFGHRAIWVAERRWIEMRLQAEQDMGVTIPATDMTVELEAGEEICTEVSAKFTPEQVADELAVAGMAVVATWTDPAGDYLLTLARPVE